MVQYCGTVALIGLVNAGKSSLLNALVGQKIAPVTHKINTTRRVLNGVVTHKDAQFIFVDTPGMQARSSVPAADLILWIADAKREPAQPPLRLPEGTILVLNQIDRFENKAKLLPIVQQWQQLLDPDHVLLVSAKTGEGLEELLK